MMPTVRRLLIGCWFWDPVVTSTVASSEKKYGTLVLSWFLWTCKKLFYIRRQKTQNSLQCQIHLVHVKLSHVPSSAWSKRPKTKLIPIHAYTPSAFRQQEHAITTTRGRHKKPGRQQLEVTCWRIVPATQQSENIHSTALPASDIKVIYLSLHSQMKVLVLHASNIET